MALKTTPLVADRGENESRKVESIVYNCPASRLSRRAIRELAEQHGVDEGDLMDAAVAAGKFTAVGRPPKPKFTLAQRLAGLKGNASPEVAGEILGLDPGVVWGHWTGENVLTERPRVQKALPEAVVQKIREEPAKVKDRVIAKRYHACVSTVRAIRASVGKSAMQLPEWLVDAIREAKDHYPRPTLTEVAERTGVDPSYVSYVWSGRRRQGYFRSRKGVAGAQTTEP